MGKKLMKVLSVSLLLLAGFIRCSENDAPTVGYHEVWRASIASWASQQVLASMVLFEDERGFLVTRFTVENQDWLAQVSTATGQPNKLTEWQPPLAGAIKQGSGFWPGIGYIYFNELTDQGNEFLKTIVKADLSIQTQNLQLDRPLSFDNIQCSPDFYFMTEAVEGQQAITIKKRDYGNSNIWTQEVRERWIRPSPYMSRDALIFERTNSLDSLSYTCVNLGAGTTRWSKTLIPGLLANELPNSGGWIVSGEYLMESLVLYYENPTLAELSIAAVRLSDGAVIEISRIKLPEDLPLSQVIQATNGGFLVALGNQQKTVLQKVGADGNMEWSTEFDEPVNVFQNNQGSVYAAGRTLLIRFDPL
ncbi:MAG: hypothetical protein ACK5DD_09100 [Cyclobacteriaceae bacterium]|jgi:hypothetical protein